MILSFQYTCSLLMRKLKTAFVEEYFIMVGKIILYNFSNVQFENVSYFRKFKKKSIFEIFKNKKPHSLKKHQQGY